MEEQNNFIFWEEINSDIIYNKLFPQSLEGRIILCLYDRINRKEISSSFTHSDLESAIKTVKPNNVRDTQGTLNNKLQKYFLWHNRHNSTYSLKDHAIRFGELAQSTLIAHFEPAKIEKLCRNLRKELKKYIDENDFPYWKEFHLDKNRHEFHQQIEVLDEKLRILISELELNRRNESNFIVSLELMIEKLSSIESEYQKLETAFSEIEIIRGFLYEYLQNDSHENLLKEKIQNAIDFFSNTESKLEGVNIRINKIQPVIQKQIAVYGRSGFASKTNRFIEYLLDNSVLSNQKIELPQNINRIPTSTSHIAFNALRPWNDPPQITPRKVHKTTKEQRKEAFSSEIAKIELQSLAIKLMQEFDIELIQKKEIYISEYYSKILDGGLGKFDLAILFSYLIIKKYDSDIKWTLEVLSIPINYTTKKSIIALWEIKIFQKISDI